MTTQLIREMDPQERPRERLLKQGAESLKTSELIAILLRTGMKGASALDVAEKMLSQYGHSLEALSRASVNELAKIKAVGQTKAIQLKAAFTLGARLSRSTAESRTVETPEDVYALLGEEMRLLDYESVRVISVNTRYKFLAVDEISNGTLNSSVFHPREAFRHAIGRQAYGVILVHNHPSGDPSPSKADREVTRQLKAAGDVLQIEVLDHIILGAPRANQPQAWFSFRQQGLL
ncbi:MAG: hypothetical protein B9S32_01565 [Verrucomicrobia bacterium Tous-C9LFEB]|nr:MAG: hypothetical protein B9S32_01565 [Verrucomicrobia bacterium Tous-C9LFEB]